MALKTLFNQIQSHLPTKEILAKLESNNTLYLNKFAGSSVAFQIKHIHDLKIPAWVITPDEESARTLESDLLELGSSDVLYFPATAEKPYDTDVISDPSLLVQRSDIIQQVSAKKYPLVVASAKSIFEKIGSPTNFKKSTLILTKDDEFDLDHLREKLVSQGYEIVSFVGAPGEVAFRGGIVDVFPYSGTYPVRIEFFGDQIESIREFDPGSQRSVSFLNEARLVPNVNSIGNDQKESVFSYIDKNTLLIVIQPDLVENNIDELWVHATQNFSQLRNSDAPEPMHLFIDFQEYQNTLNDYKKIYFQGIFEQSGHEIIEWNAGPQPDFNSSIKILKSDIQDRSKKEYQTWILCDNDGQRDRFEELLGEPNSSMNYLLLINSIHEGFIHHDSKIAVYTDHQIFNRYHRPKVRQKKFRGGFSVKELRDLKVGDFVVHIDHGIGQFQGFKQIVVKNIAQEAVVVQYANDSILYVNVSSLHKLQKYSGKDGTAPKITKLGSGEWARKKARTKSQIKDIARDLILLYAKRKANKAFAFSPDSGMQLELEASFEFEETPDQN
ncbi:MAG TPA: transcription-repair coupling factor, partial [Bacteroidetes bacterium]|nr:transcription-repair coupling factor [Bacteroidota bacterium]